MYLGLDPKKIKMKRNELKANFNTREKQEVGAMIFRYFMKLVIDDVLQGAYFHFTGLYQATLRGTLFSTEEELELIPDDVRCGIIMCEYGKKRKNILNVRRKKKQMLREWLKKHEPYRDTYPKDYIDAVHEKFKPLCIEDVKYFIHYGIRGFVDANHVNCTVFFSDVEDFLYLGDVLAEDDEYYKMKYGERMRKKYDYIYRRQKLEYSGMYAFLKPEHLEDYNKQDEIVTLENITVTKSLKFVQKLNKYFEGQILKLNVEEPSETSRFYKIYQFSKEDSELCDK